MNRSTATLTSASVDSKCSFSQVADSEDTSCLPVTFPAEDAILIRSGSVPSISGMSTVAYKSRILEGDPCAWFLTSASCPCDHETHGWVKFFNNNSEMVSR